MNQPVPIDAGLRPEIGWLGFEAMSLNGVIGAGIFALPAVAARDPRRDIPKALVLSVLAICGLYVLIQLVSVSVHPGLAGSDRPLIEVMELLAVPGGAALMAAGAVFSITGNVSSMMLSGPRMVYAMGRTGVLPAWFGSVHPGFATPTNAILFLGALGLGLALSGSFIWLAAMSTVVRLIVYAACILALPRLESRADADEAPFAPPGAEGGLKRLNLPVSDASDRVCYPVMWRMVF